MFSSLIALTPSSTRTPPALPSALSQQFASSAPLSASVQAGPVDFIRQALPTRLLPGLA